MEATTVFSFRRHFRPFLFDLFNVLEGMSIYILNDDENDDARVDVPSYVQMYKIRTCACP